MKTRIIRLDQVKTDAVASDLVDTIANHIKLSTLVHQMNVAHKLQSNGGACRCLFWSAGTVFFGFSDRDEKVHAEQDCFMKMNDVGFKVSRNSLWLMYVDLEPCHSKRYVGHNCRAYFDADAGTVDPTQQGRYSLRNSQGGSFWPYQTNGIVLYTFDQTAPGEKSLASFMHDNASAADSLLSQLGVSPLEFNRQHYGIGYFKLGKDAQTFT